MDASRRRFCRSLVSAAVASAFLPIIREVEAFEPVTYGISPTTTGRFSCSAPEWQNIPAGKYTAVFEGVRDLVRFTPCPELDYPYLEFRILASVP